MVLDGALKFKTKTWKGTRYGDSWLLLILADSNQIQILVTMRVFLIGFMGVGKSTLGRLAAETLSVDFMDFDVLIEEHQEMSISEIFSAYGETYFRKLEHDLLREVIQTRDDFIMGTGGGLPCFHNNLEVMNEHGQTIYLKASAEAIAERLWNSSGSRPLIANKSKEELATFVEETLGNRNKYYLRATHVLDVDLALSKSVNAHQLIQIINQL